MATAVHAMKSFAYCDEHPDAPLIERYADGDRRCSECGLVVGERIIDNRSEWRSFGNNDKGNGVDPSRVGAAQDANDELAALKMSSIPGVAADDPLQKAQNRNLMSSAERGFANAKREMGRIGAALHLTESILDRARTLYKQVAEKKIVKSRSQDAVCASVVYLACREMKHPRTFKEICDVTTVPKKTIGRVCKIIMAGETVSQTSAADIVGRIVMRAGMLHEHRSIAEHVARAAETAGIVVGRNPASIAAAAVYLVIITLGLDTTIGAVSGASGVADATISLVHKIMAGHQDKLLPPSTLAAMAKRDSMKAPVKIEPKHEPMA